MSVVFTILFRRSVEMNAPMAQQSAHLGSSAQKRVSEARTRHVRRRHASPSPRGRERVAETHGGSLPRQKLSEPCGVLQRRSSCWRRHHRESSVPSVPSECDPRRAEPRSTRRRGASRGRLTIAPRRVRVHPPVMITERRLRRRDAACARGARRVSSRANDARCNKKTSSRGFGRHTLAAGRVCATSCSRATPPRQKTASQRTPFSQQEAKLRLASLEYAHALGPAPSCLHARDDGRGARVRRRTRGHGNSSLASQ